MDRPLRCSAANSSPVKSGHLLFTLKPLPTWQGDGWTMSEIIRWLTEDQASTYVSRSPRTLRMWRQHNEVVAHRQSRSRVLYAVDSLNRCAAIQDSRREQLSGRPVKLKQDA